MSLPQESSRKHKSFCCRKGNLIISLWIYDLFPNDSGSRSQHLLLRLLCKLKMFPDFFAETQTHSTHSSKGMKSSQTSSVLHFLTLLIPCLQFSHSFTSGSRNEHEIPPHPFLFQASSSQGFPATFCSEPFRHELQRRCELAGWHLLMEVAMISTNLCLWMGKHGYFAKESDRFKFQYRNNPGE